MDVNFNKLDFYHQSLNSSTRTTLVRIGSGVIFGLQTDEREVLENNTKEIILVKERKKDFEFLFLMKNGDSYIVTSESKHDQMISCETITKNVNKSGKVFLINLTLLVIVFELDIFLNYGKTRKILNL
jgi:hypothetical protein